VRPHAWLLALLLPALFGASRPRGLGDVTEVRHWSYPGYTRVVVQTTSLVRTQVERVPADPAAQRPERLFVDLGGVWVGTRFERPIAVGDGLLRGKVEGFAELMLGHVQAGSVDENGLGIRQGQDAQLNTASRLRAR